MTGGGYRSVACRRRETQVAGGACGSARGARKWREGAAAGAANYARDFASRAAEYATSGTQELNQAINHDRVRRLIPLGLMDEVAIVGSADMVRRRLNHYASIGVNNIFVPLPKEETILEYTTMISNIGGP